MATPKIIADFETQLSTALAVGGTSFTLASATDDDGVALPSGAYYFTIDNGSSNKEYVLGTLASTAVTAVSSVSRQGTETSGVVRAHRVGASVIMTDFATYKKYMDGIALVSAPDGDASTKGVYQMATQAQTDAGTIVGSTNSNLVVNPSTQRGRAYNDYAADAGVSDAYAITVTPAITAYATGQVFTFKANTANTGAATLAVSGLAAKDIRKNVSSALATGDILASQILTVVYDGTNFQVTSDVPAGLPTTQTFTTVGANTWTKPTGLKYVVVEAVGGGGTGGTSNGVNGGGGGGGGYCRKRIAASSLGATETATVGTVATNTTFGPHLTAGGGATATTNTPGAGGTATDGDLNIPGQAGSWSPLNGINSGAGIGGNSYMGFGGYALRNTSSSATADGIGGGLYGGGGSGGSDAADGTPTGGTGGTGATGIIIVTEYY